MLRPLVSRNAIAVRFLLAVAKPTPAAKPLLNAHVGDLEKRWAHLPDAEQSAMAADLGARMALPWLQLLPAEKKAAYYISFGEWGPRKPLHQPGEKAKVFWGTVSGVVGGIALFFVSRMFAGDKPVTMNRQWQDKSDEYLKSKNANPFTGYSQVQ